MNIIPRRLLLVGAAPFAVAAVYGGSIAFAQSGEEPTPTPTEDAAPQSPAEPETVPDGTKDRDGCPEKGGGFGESETPDSGTATLF